MSVLARSWRARDAGGRNAKWYVQDAKARTELLVCDGMTEDWGVWRKPDAGCSCLCSGSRCPPPGNPAVAHLAQHVPELLRRV